MRDLQQEIRIKKLERIHALSVWVPVWISINLLLILAGAVNLALEGLNNTYAQIQLVIGGLMAVGYLLWVKKVTAFLDSVHADRDKQ